MQRERRGDACADRLEPRPVELRRLAVDGRGRCRSRRPGSRRPSASMNSGAWAGSVSAPAATARGDVLVAGDAAELRLDAGTVRAAELDGAPRRTRRSPRTAARSRRPSRRRRRPRSAALDQPRGRRSGRAGRRPRASARPAAATSAASSRAPPRLGVGARADQEDHPGAGLGRRRAATAAAASRS